MGRKWLALPLIAILLSSATWGKKPKTSFDKAVDFSRYKTYAWANGTAAPDSVMDGVIIRNIDYELQRLGLQPAPASTADLLVRYDVAGDAQASSAASDPTYTATGGYAPTTYWPAWTSGGAVDIRMKGSLCVRLMDQVKQTVIWTSIAEAGLDSRRYKRAQQVIEIIGKMFKDFPRKN